jgi:hypothetical protein
MIKLIFLAGLIFFGYGVFVLIKRRDFKMALVGAGMTLLFFFGFIGVFDETTEKNEASEQQTITEDNKESISIKPAVNSVTAPEEQTDITDDISNQAKTNSTAVVTLGYTPDEFKNRFNDASQQIGSHLKIENLTIQDGPVQDTFNYAFNDQIAIVGSVHKKDGNVRDLMLICQSDGTPSSAADIFVAMGLLIMATNPDLNQDERTEVMKELGLLGDDIDLSNLDKKTIRNNIEYHITFSPQTGFIFSAGHVNDQE